MQKILTFVMMIFMALGPVASLSAQVNSVEWINSNASSGNILEENIEKSIEESSKNRAEENSQQHAQNDTKHNCCEESKSKSQCNCSYQNECDIQNLTFFALSKPQLQVLASIDSAAVITTYLPVFLNPESSSIYRPPIT